jgi:ribosomal protein S18 acetylase RimI-like enzyme
VFDKTLPRYAAQVPAEAGMGAGRADLDIRLRPARQADAAYLYALHRASMRAYVEAVWGWDDDFQRAHHARTFDPAATQIVTLDGVDVGVLKVEDRPGTRYIGLVEVHPDHQRHGVGRTVLGRVLADAEIARLPVELDVLAVNTRAYALYASLGFVEQYRHGDGDIKIRMRREPHGSRRGTVLPGGV